MAATSSQQGFFSQQQGTLGGAGGSEDPSARAFLLSGSALSSDDIQQEFKQLPTTQQLLRTREIPWDIYMTARLITDRDLQLLRRYDKKDPQQKKLLLSDGGEKYVRAMMSVLQNVTKEETVQYVLALVDEVLEGNSQRARFFFSLTYGEGEDSVLDPYGILLRLLQRDDWFTQEKAALILSQVVAHRPNKEALGEAVMPDGTLVGDDVGKAILAFIDWCLSQLRRPAHPVNAVPTAVHCLAVMLREKPVRPLVCKAGGVGLIMALVGMPQGGINVQVQYESILCVWLLSLYGPGNESLSTPALVNRLVDVVRLAHKEKVIRVALMALKSLLDESGKMALEMSAVENGLPKALENRAEQTWEDGDIPDLLEDLQERMDAGVLAMSSLERYRKEVMQGTLVPGPMHDSEEFWSENAEKLADNNAALLKALLRLLDASNDHVTLCLACRDVSNFVTHYPHGKGLIADLQAKPLVMRLMAHPDSGVQREALLCVQKLLLSKNTLGYMAQVQDS
ncbi:Putative V-type proton ATPase subunit H [Picochlorum sp. SENEW3]|nr:Putative V-type proton ATPase subunit H [Picochlorum sp. SENEW3]